MFRWLYIGSGRIAKKTAAEITAGGNHTLVYVYSRNKQTSSNLALKYSAQSVEDLSEVDIDEIDGIYIATPHNSHYEYIVKCCSMKKPMFVEKPYVVNTIEYKKVKMLEVKYGIMIIEAMCMLFNPLLQEIKERIRKNGKVISITIHYALAMRHILRLPRLTDIHYAGGTLMEIGVYGIAFCNYLIGEMPSFVNIDAKVRGGVDLSDRISLTYEGIKCDLNVSLDTFSGIPKAIIHTDVLDIIVPWFSNPEKYIAKYKDGKETIEKRSGKYIFEFDAFVEITRKGSSEYADVLLCTEHTVKCLDECRKMIGVRYPNDMQI